MTATLSIIAWGVGVALGIIAAEAIVGWLADRAAKREREILDGGA